MGEMSVFDSNLTHALSHINPLAPNVVLMEKVRGASTMIQVFLDRGYPVILLDEALANPTIYPNAR